MDLRRLFGVMASLLGALALAGAGGEPAMKASLYRGLGALWDEVRQSSRWRSPLGPERLALQEAGEGALDFAASGCQGEPPARLEERLQRAGFELRRFAGALALVEAPGARRGGGLYVLRCGPAAPLVLQAPHGMHDLNTGRGALRLFAEGRARAVFVNTVHRYRALPGELREDRAHPADVAHEPGSFFHALTLAFAASDPELRFVQLHGMEGPAEGSQWVLSSGQASAPPSALGEALRGWGGAGEVFGMDADRLGATLNVQQRALNRGGVGRFVHLELSLALRRRLLREAQLRRALEEHLLKGWW